MSSRGGEATRILAQYKRSVLLGKANLPLAQARRLVGPDSAYHLYFRHETGKRRKKKAGRDSERASA